MSTPSDRDVRNAWHANAVYGMCTACGAIEVALLAASGARDYSAIGESAEYPIGYGCEMCS